jgi:large subunit ribosomal protein L6
MVSRVAKAPVEFPNDVDVKLAGQEITVKGKKGELSRVVHPAVKVSVAEKLISVAPAKEIVESNALAGTMRALINNMVVGVTEGFERKLTLIGVGYRAKAQGKTLNLTVGFSHPVNMEMPEGITVETPSNTEIIVKGIDKQKVCQMAANIRAVRPPEPYKGKGIRYADEHVPLKEGKKK